MGLLRLLTEYVFEKVDGVERGFARRKYCTSVTVVAFCHTINIPDK